MRASCGSEAVWRACRRASYVGTAFLASALLANVFVPRGAGQRHRRLQLRRSLLKLPAPTAKPDQVPRFKTVEDGTCASAGLFPIDDRTVCEAAARGLGLPDMQPAATVVEDRPEGCYIYTIEGQSGFDEHRDALWMALSPASKGKGAETSEEGSNKFRWPVCTSQAKCGTVEEGLEYEGEAYAHIDNVPDAGVCCEKCQADFRCGAWTWGEQNGFVCSLLRPRPDRSVPRSKRRKDIVSGLPFRSSQPGALFCLALLQPTGYELGLLQLQLREEQGIFACDEYALYSSTVLEISPGVRSSAIGSDLRCKYGGDSGTALNTGIFIALWKKVLSDGQFRFSDWTVKVDPDAVFFPVRLRGILQGLQKTHEEGLNGVYVNNCKYGLHGPIEVFSRKAMDAYAENYQKCEQHLWFAYSHWGEDMYMDQCLQKVVNVSRIDEWALICEDHCDCPEYAECKTGAVTFHPFKTVDSYRQCMLNAGVVLKT